MENTAHKIEKKERTNDVKLSENVPFSKMLLSAGVRSGLSKAGFLYPTVIQANAIPMGIAGLDLVVQSKSGTGKTLIFAVVLLEIFRNEVQEPQSLVLAPTREIAVQIEAILNSIGSCSTGFAAISVIGGLEVTGDRKKLQSARAIVGTPGRVLHLITNGVLNTSKINLLVVDEADKMMNQTFRSDFDKIYNSLPAKRQIIACSATFCQDLDSKLAKFMRNPLLISTDKRSTLLVGIKQLVYDIADEKTSILEMTAKVNALKQIFSSFSFKQCLVFSNSQARAETYQSFLDKDGWSCDAISGALDQKTRLGMFVKFREFKTRILIATDLMSRGIDSENVNLVVNLEVPDDSATYLHRIGRAGRFGSQGIAVTFVSSDKDRKKFYKLLKTIGNGMQVLMFPKEQTVNLWNFSNSENERQLLGTFEENSKVEVEKENLNNNTPEPSSKTPDLKARRMSLHDDEAVKLDMLSQLINKKSEDSGFNDKNRNLFDDFLEAVSPDKGENEREAKKVMSEKYEDTKKSMLGVLCGLSKAVNNLDIALNPFEDYDVDKAVRFPQNTEKFKNGDYFNVDAVFSPETETETNSTEALSSCQSNQIVADLNWNNNTSSKQTSFISSPSQELSNVHIPESLTAVPLEKAKLQSLLIQMPVRTVSGDLFHNYVSFRSTRDISQKKNIPETFPLKEVVSNDCYNKDYAQASKMLPTTAAVSHFKSTKPSKEVIKQVIRQVADNIVSSSDSQKPSPTHPVIFEPEPSTSRATLKLKTLKKSSPPLETSTDSSITSHYPNTSPIASANQTGQELFNISSDQTGTDCMNLSYNTSDLNASTKQDYVGQLERPVSESSNETDSATDTASENDEESSGFDERTSPEPSSGVISSENTTDTSEYCTSTSETKDAQSQDFICDLESTDCDQPPNSEVDFNAAYQTAYSKWTNFYWNQITQIQDYVRFSKYAGLNAPRYS